LQVGLTPAVMAEIRREVRRANRRSFHAAVGAALIVAAALLLGLGDQSPVLLWNVPLATWLLGGAGAVLLIGNWPGRE
ncbi:MAG: ubiquinone biosynthesis regulatory protein kinase UbiB, partial [Pseudomonadota bacterium]|nr:ubiquinone biosynthesis regulatory protein kinase UbiB [Pseudomonadota bacterium]